MIKSLLSASALTMAFSGTAMAQSDGGCTSCAAPKEIKLAQLGPRAIPTEMGTAIPGVPPTNGDSINTCCAPIAAQKEKFGAMFRLQQSPGKNITQTYGVTFMPTAELDTQLKAFTPFVGLQVPAGLYGNSVMLHAEMRQLAEAPSVNVNSSNFSNNGALDVPVYAHSLRAWWIPNTGGLTPSGIWNGPHAGPPIHSWENQFEDNRASMAPNHMAPDKWYMIKLTWKVAMKNRPHGTPNDPSWIVQDLNCANAKPIYVRFLVRGGSVNKVAGGAQPTAPSVGEVSIVN